MTPGLKYQHVTLFQKQRLRTYTRNASSNGVLVVDGDAKFKQGLCANIDDGVWNASSSAHIAWQDAQIFKYLDENIASCIYMTPIQSWVIVLLISSY